MGLFNSLNSDDSGSYICQEEEEEEEVAPRHLHT